MGPSVSGAHPPNGITFGSRIILSTLWTPEELIGKPEDKFAVRQPAPSNRNPPQRLSPVNTHIPLNPEMQNSIRRMEMRILRTQAQYELLWEALREKAIAKQIDPAEMRKIPKAPLVFRFPYGDCSSQALDKLKQNGLPAIQWDIVAGDPEKGRSPKEIAQVILQQVRPGGFSEILLQKKCR